jgi:hypothetical protein
MENSIRVTTTHGHGHILESAEQDLYLAVVTGKRGTLNAANLLLSTMRA